MPGISINSIFTGNNAIIRALHIRIMYTPAERLIRMERREKLMEFRVLYCIALEALHEVRLLLRNPLTRRIYQVRLLNDYRKILVSFIKNRYTRRLVNDHPNAPEALNFTDDIQKIKKNINDTFDFEINDKNLRHIKRYTAWFNKQLKQF